MTRRVVPLDSIKGNVIASRVTAPSAWYVLPPVAWGNISGGERDQLVNAQAKRFAALTPRRLHWRVTTRPVTVEGWQRRQSATARARAPHGADWASRHAATVEHINRQGFTTKQCFFGVELSRPGTSWENVTDLFRRAGTRPVTDEDDIWRIVSRPGLSARRASTIELEWLIHRSVRLGHDAIVPPSIGGDWARADMEAFTADVTEEMDPYGKWVKITAPTAGRINGDPVDRYVSVVTIGRMAEMGDDALANPWLAICDASLPFPVEIAVTADVLTPAEVINRTEFAQRKVKGQLRDTEKYDRDEHHTLGTASRHADEIQEDVEAGMPDLATRMDVWARIAVAGASGQEALDRAQAVADEYSPEIAVVPYTSTAYLEFTPGERVYGGGSNRHQLGVTTVSVGMPQVGARIGHDDGMYLGPTTSSVVDRVPVRWDPYRSMGLNGQGTTVITGVTGAGKSMLVSLIVSEAVQDGAVGFVIDQSGPMADMTRLPKLRGYVAHWDLTDAPRPGALNPYAIVVDPNPAFYPATKIGRARYQRKVEQAEERRKQLCGHTLLSLVKPSLQDQWMAGIVIDDAIDQVPASRSTSPIEVIDALRDAAGMSGRARLILDREAGAGRRVDHVDDEEFVRFSRYCARELERIRKQPDAGLIFPTDTELDYTHGDDVRLTIVTARDLILPKKDKKTDWTSLESRGAALWLLVGWSIQQQIFAADRNLPKIMGTDEIYKLTSNPMGVGLFDQLAHDARKHRCRNVLTCHSVKELDRVEGLANLVDTWFIGRTIAPDAQADSIAAIRVPTGVGHEEQLGEQVPGEFLARIDGEVDTIQIDLDNYPDHAANQDTTPDEAKIAVGDGLVDFDVDGFDPVGAL